MARRLMVAAVLIRDVSMELASPDREALAGLADSLEREADRLCQRPFSKVSAGVDFDGLIFAIRRLGAALDPEMEFNLDPDTSVST